MIGLGGSIASALPWLMTNVLHFKNTAASGVIPDNVKWSFYIGAFFFLSAVLWTVFTSKEYPPTQAELDLAAKEKAKGHSVFKEIFEAIKNMPQRMKMLAVVQFFTWPGLFLMWFYYSTAVARNVFHAVSETDPLYAEGTGFAGLTLASYNIVTFVFSLLFLPAIAQKFGRKITHSICLLCGAIGLISVAFVTNKYFLFASMAGVGIAWASILSMPYAMLSGVLPPNKVGVYMGIFNFFIVLPEIIASLGFGWVMKNLLNNDRLIAVEIGGGLMIIAALLCYFLVNEKNES